MAGLTAAGVVEAWEDGQAEDPVGRGLAVLAAACPERDVHEWAAVSVPAFDVALLEVRAATLGRWVDAVVDCPACGEVLDVGFEVPPDAGGPPDGQHELVVGGHRVVFRLPTADDLRQVGRRSGSEVRERLARRCLVEGGAPLLDDEGRLPDGAVDLLSAAMGEIVGLDAQGAVAVACPGCAHEWSADMDMAAFVWAEVAGEARRLLLEVATLAGAFGWGEASVLAMSAARRQAYLELAVG